MDGYFSGTIYFGSAFSLVANGSINSDAFFAKLNSSTGVDEINKNESANIFPNPASNHLTVALRNNNKKIKITISDIAGKIMYANTFSEQQKIEVNIKDFTEGVYILQIQWNNFKEMKKLIITR